MMLPFNLWWALLITFGSPRRADHCEWAAHIWSHITGLRRCMHRLCILRFTEWWSVLLFTYGTQSWQPLEGEDTTS